MNNEQLIKSAFERFGCDKAAHGYEKIYKDIIFNVDSLLEIGVQRGKSLASWHYLRPDCELYGLDISKKRIVEKLIPNNCSITISNSTKETAFKQTFDLIIDDGSHKLTDQKLTFDNYHNLFKKYYVIEDVFVSDTVDNVTEMISYVKSKGYRNINLYSSKQDPVHAYLHHLDYRHSPKVKEWVDIFSIIVTK